jgi:cold shock CspA family protein
MRGIVTRYDTARGYGFLRGDFSRVDTLFYKSAVVGGVVPKVDSVCEYVETVGKDGRPRATRVRPI